MDLMFNGKKVMGGGGVSMDQVNAAIDSKLENVQPEEVYSTEETRIGTWIDGRPLYRKTFMLTSPSTILTDTNLDGGKIDNAKTIVSIIGVLHQGATTLPMPFSIGNYAIIAGVKGNNIYMHVSSPYNGLPVTIHVEYTKTTDEPIKIPAVALFPQETLKEMKECGLDKILLEQEASD